MLRRAALVTGLLAVACGKPGYVPDNTTFEGSVHGVTLSDPHALFSSQEGAFGVNDATFFVSDVPNACDAIRGSSSTTNPRSTVHDERGNRLPSLVLDLRGHSDLNSNRREYGNGFTASWDPGAPAECESLTGDGTQSDGGTCPRVIKADGGTAWIYESDSTRVDDKPTAVAKYRVHIGEDWVSGTVVGEPCSAVSGGCSVAGGSAGLVGVALCLFALRLRSRRPC